MPPTIKKCGHPKGHEVTVIGLPAKKGRRNTTEPCKLRLQPFIKLHTSIKEKGMLNRWFGLPVQIMFYIYSNVEVVC